MGVSNSQLQPHELIAFKKLPTDVPLENIEIPERPENRKPTNVKWLIVFGVFVVILLPFLIYTMYYSNIKRLIYRYDNCGNLCGQKNKQWDGIECSGADMTTKPYLQYAYYADSEKVNNVKLKEYRCVQDCSKGYFPRMGRCFQGHTSADGKVIFDEYDIDFGVYLASVKWQIIISCLLSVLVSIGMVFLFKYAVAFVVWGIFVGCLLGMVTLIAIFCYFSTSASSSSPFSNVEGTSLVVMIAIFTILAIILVVLLIWYRRKIQLVIVLLKEATKAVFDMPGIMLAPLLSVLVTLILTVIFVLTFYAATSAGTLKLGTNNRYNYKPNGVMLFTMWYNFVIYLWTCQFFTGLQYMTIAGAVSKWYFSRDKKFLGSPIVTSLSNAFRFHLGTVALGSLIIAIVQVIKTIILGLISNERCRGVVKSCLDPIETFFRFMSKNAYIITAMHGQAFIKSGKRAAKLIMQNISDVIAINYIGDFVLGMAKFLIILITVLLSVGIFAIAPGSLESGNMIGYFIIILVSAIVAWITFGVFETAIDTIFICYCEDNILNDGMERQYFMSRNLMEFVQSSREVYKKK